MRERNQLITQSCCKHGLNYAIVLSLVKFHRVKFYGYAEFNFGLAGKIKASDDRIADGILEFLPRFYSLWTQCPTLTRRLARIALNNRLLESEVRFRQITTDVIQL